MTLSAISHSGEQPLIDCHHHFWALADIHYPWLSDQYDPHFFLGDYRSICRPVLPDELRATVPAGYRLIGSVHCEAEVERAQTLAETRWITGLAEQQGLPSAHVGWAPFGQDHCAAVLDAQCELPLFRGVRAKPITASRPQHKESVLNQPGSLQDAHWLSGLTLLQERGLSWDLRVPAWHLQEAAQALQDYPDLRVILNHTGLPWDRSPAGLEQWRAGLTALAANPNVCIKLSELGTPLQAWDRQQNLQLLCDAIRLFGPQRCLYASNFPVAGIQVSYADWLAMIEEAIALTAPKARDDILWRNACHWYRLLPADIT